MKAFHFSLQAVLTLRLEKEQEAQRAVAQAVHGVMVVKSGLAALGAALASLGEELRGRMDRGIPAHDLAQLGGYRVVLTERRQQLEGDLAKAEEKLRQTQVALLRANQDRQVLDHYRRKLLRLHDQREAREEQKLLDDLAGRAPVAAGASRRLSAEEFTP